MMKPQRIQLSRKKGWRMPPNTVKVTRPGRFGNPFKVDAAGEYLLCDASHRRTILCPWVIFDHAQDFDKNPATAAMAVDHYRRWMNHEFDAARVVMPCRIGKLDLADIRGKNLACWCKIYAADGSRVPCHADILLSIANDIQIEEICAPLTTPN